jgi:hypothetical protein
MGVKEKVAAIRLKKENCEKHGNASWGPCYKQFVESEN